MSHLGTEKNKLSKYIIRQAWTTTKLRSKCSSGLRGAAEVSETPTARKRLEQKVGAQFLSVDLRNHITMITQSSW